MIICLCHRVSDRDIHQAVADGIDCFEDLQGWTRAGTQCGRCREMAGEVFDQALACPGHCRGRMAAGCASAQPASMPLGLPVAALESVAHRPSGASPRAA